MQAPDCAGLLLAGGQGRRVGGADKGLLMWQGQALVDAVAARMAVQVSPLALSANRNLEAYRLRGLPVLQDAPEQAGLGPLAGVLVGLRWAQSQGAQWLFTCPCDSPLLPLDLAPRLLAAANTSGALAAVPHLSERWQGTHALWSVQLAEPLQRALRARQLRVQGFLQSQAACSLDLSAEAASFANLNQLDDGLSF